MSGGMSTIGPALAAAGTALNVTSNLQAAKATQIMAQRRMAAAQVEAQQLNQNAGLKEAQGQMVGAEARRQGQVVNSDLVAQAAASGGGASDPTVVNLMARNTAYSEYKAMMGQYEGADAARVLRNQAQMSLYGGAVNQADADATAAAYRQKAVISAITGGANAMAKYWTAPKTAATGAGLDAGSGDWTADRYGLDVTRAA